MIENPIRFFNFFFFFNRLRDIHLRTVLISKDPALFTTFSYKISARFFASTLASRARRNVEMKFFLEITYVTTNFSWHRARHVASEKKKIIKNLEYYTEAWDILCPVENLRGILEISVVGRIKKMLFSR